MLFVTGGAGFIGGNFIHHWFARCDEPVVVIDRLTYAGNPQTIAAFLADGRAELAQVDIRDAGALAALFVRHRPRAVVHFAAESHVDRSIAGPDAFVQTNVVGTCTLLAAARAHREALPGPERDAFRFLHVSTDEVYGSLGPTEAPFTEASACAPNSPYAASKAASDHFVRAYAQTYGLPALTIHCSNNYGPYQFPEKLVPLVILNALEGRALPLYGDGRNVRDWLYVRDHCEAICQVLERGRPGETYNVGGRSEMANLDVVQAICRELDVLRPRTDGRSYAGQIAFVADRPGHDRRYAMDPAKIEQEIGWHPTETFASGLARTVRWYLDNAAWTDAVRDGSYRAWLAQQYGTRAGVR